MFVPVTHPFLHHISGCHPRHIGARVLSDTKSAIPPCRCPFLHTPLLLARISGHEGSDSDAEVSDFARRSPACSFPDGMAADQTRAHSRLGSSLAAPVSPELVLANAGAEAVDGEIEPTASMVLGPKNVDSLPLMVMLGNSGLRAELPGRVA